MKTLWCRIFQGRPSIFMKERNVLVRSGIVICALLSTANWSGFAQTATETSDLSVTSVRKALASEHAAIAAHPKDPTNYVNLAYTLTDAGIGEQARVAAADATRVAPTSAFAFSAQGWVLHHNSIGVDYGSGFDYDGAFKRISKSHRTRSPGSRRTSELGQLAGVQS